MKNPIVEQDYKTEGAFHAALVKERDDFFADLTIHSELEILDRFTVAVSDEIHGEPDSVNYSEGWSHRPKDQGGLVWELKRRLKLRESKK